MGWRDAPVITAKPAKPVKARWESAPIVQEAPPTPTFAYGVGGPLQDIGRGIAKGIGTTAVGIADIIDAGMAALGIDPRDKWAFESLRPSPPTSGIERAAMTAEQAAEFLAIPGPAKVRGAMKALEYGKTGLAAAGLAGAQGAGGGGAVATGLMAAIPVAGGVEAVGRWAGSKAEPLVRAAIKPLVSSMQKVAGASREGLNAKASALIKWILQNRVTSPEKARGIFQRAEVELAHILKTKNAPTDAATRAARYLDSLERSAVKQALPAEDVATIRRAAKEMLETGLGEDVAVKVPAVIERRPDIIGKGKADKGVTLFDYAGRPMVVKPATEKIVRRLRPEVPAEEALERARATSRWETRKAWGEQKGAQQEASKAIERALRDAVKTALPELRPLLKTEGMALQAEKVLERAAFRAANREVVSLPAHVVAAGELARGKLPIFAFAANWLRNNQLKAGIYADRLAKAIREGNAPQVAFILHRLGVGVSPQLMRPAPATP
jgi:hypothetical protein